MFGQSLRPKFLGRGVDFSFFELLALLNRCFVLKKVFVVIFLFISLQKMFESFPVPYSNVDMSQGLSNVFNQVKIFTLSKFYLVRFPKGSRQKKRTPPQP